MSELSLEPYAVQQRWHLPAPQPGGVWRQILSTYVMDLARACDGNQTGSEPAPVIGHIKLLVLFPDRGYLRVSAVSANHQPTCTGLVPDGLDSLSLTLNVLVYGLTRDALQKRAADIAVALAAAHAGRVTVEDTSDVGRSTSPHSGDHSHHHHAG